MDQASQLFVRPDLRRHDAITLPRVVIHFAVAPHATMTWRAHRDAEIRAHNVALWVTRPPCVDDFWVRPGETMHIRRGERIWLSADGEIPAEMSITTAYIRRGERLRRAFADLRRFARERWRRCA